MSERGLAKTSKPFRRTRMGNWRFENSSKPKFERANPQHYDCAGDDGYRRNYDSIDWSDDGRSKKDT